MQNQWWKSLARWQVRLTDAPFLDKFIRTIGCVGAICVGLLVMMGPFSLHITLEVLAIWSVCGYVLHYTWASRS